MTNYINPAQHAGFAIAGVVAAALIAGACGGASSSAKTAATSTPTVADAGSTGGARTPDGRFGNRTPSPDMETAIAQGTRVRGGNRTPPPDALTAIAQGTQVFGGNRTPSSGDQTAIAQGTPAGALRRFGGGGGRVLTSVATLLSIDETQLRSELQAQGASIETIAAAHGLDRPTLRLRLIAAVRQRLQDAVTSGAVPQAAADQNASDFEANIDRTIDAVGGGGLLDQPTASP